MTTSHKANDGPVAKGLRPSAPKPARASLQGTIAAAVAAPYILRGGASPNSKLNIASIGAGGKGASDRKFAEQEGNNIVAVCDVDARRVAAALKDHPGAKPYADFRKMLDEMGKGIDAVIVSTPDHTHFSAAMMAIGLGKHVCVQKPLTNTIWEARELHKAAKKTGVVTQMGNQGATGEDRRRIQEWVEQGAIGKLKEIRIWTDRPIWPQGALTKRAAQKPADLDWDLWLGQVPHMDYYEYTDGEGKKGELHPFKWRGWWHFGSGALGDIGCHSIDASFRVLGGRFPALVEAQSAPVTEEIAPAWSTILYHFPEAGDQPAITLTWQDGRFINGQQNRPDRHPALDEMPEKDWRAAKNSQLIIGSDAVILGGTIYPKARREDVKKAMESGQIKQTLPRSTHPGEPQQEWAHAIKNGLQTSSNFDHAAPLTECVLLGNLAIRSGKPIEWDREKMTVTNAPEANRFVRRPAYREGWDFRA